MPMRVISNGNGNWFVTTDGAVVVGPFESDVSAKEWIDSHEGQPVAGENWSFKKPVTEVP
jgi:hypothetical protein